MEDEMNHEAAPEVQARITSSFERQGLMRHLGARLGLIAPGRVHMVLPSRPEVTQQHGYIHAGYAGAVADSAGGYAALTVFPEKTEGSPWSTRSTSWRRPQVTTLRPSERS